MANIIHIGKEESFSYADDESLYQILMDKGLWNKPSPCGGRGTCGKCKILVKGSDLPPLAEKEKTSLTRVEQEQGIRLACLLKPRGEVFLDIDNNTFDGAVIQQDHMVLEITDPPLKVLQLEIPPASLDDQRDMVTALREEAARQGQESFSLPFSLLSELPARTEDSLRFNLTLLNDRLLKIRIAVAEEEASPYGAVVDLGTTTVVLYLVDLKRGEVVDTIAAMNNQKARGGDVISRIEYACQGPDTLRELRDTIGSQLVRMADDLAQKHRIRPDIFLINGNPTMIHLLTGLIPQGIAQAPFVPQVTETLVLEGRSLFLPGYEDCPVILPASLSGYIGSDILAGVIFTGMDRGEKNTMLLDLGTNGELVMGNGESLLSCSCAAGPAFEGANISAGMAGVSGAVSHVDWEGEEYAYKTIASEPARGICGTGIIDVMALLLEKGIVDETGRFLDEEELPELKGDIKERIVTQENGDRAFVVAPGVFFTQKDVREVQMARAAIAGAVTTLLRERDITLDDLDRVYLAGGFGFWLREESAIRIGLIPSSCAGRVQVVGNSSGKGGLLMALDKEKLNRADELRSDISYIELSSNMMYQTDFVMAMTFPEGAVC